MKAPTNGAKVRQLREHRGWTQQQLADKANTSDRTVQRIEDGEGARRDIVGSVAATLGVTVEDVLASADDSGSPVEVAEGGWPVRLNRVTSGRALLDLLLWASKLRFEHDLDPDYMLAGDMERFIERCGEIAMDDLHMEQIDTAFAVEVATTEIGRIGSLNSLLKSLSRQGAYVYAGAYTHRYKFPDPFGLNDKENAERAEKGEAPLPDKLIEMVLLIHILGRDVPSVTVQADRRAEDEFLDRESSDRELGDPRTLRSEAFFKRSLDRVLPQKKRNDEDTN